MRIVKGSGSLEQPLERCVLTVGNFDGLHLGHQAIMKKVTERARALSGQAVAYTFEPHPRRVLHPGRSPRLLTTLEQKLELFEAAGVDTALVEPFDLNFAKLPAGDFVREVLHRRIGPSEVYVGYDFRYGKEREGSMRTLVDLGPHLGFSVTIIAEVKLGKRDVNSTRIRECLAEGQVQEAAALLGRRYSVRGLVVRGDQRGRGLGFPTINLEAENEILPAQGVYAGRVRFLDESPSPAKGPWPAVINVGRRPTFEGEGEMRAEAHLLDFDAECYERRVEIEFEQRLRGERRFDGPEELAARIARDAEEARAILSAPAALSS